jgi:cyanuric acid amidohydrolase
MNASVIRCHLDFPGDCKHLDRIISAEQIPFHAIKAFLSKVNGSGTPNDFSRQWAERNFVSYLQDKYGKKRGDIEKQIMFITSSGCEGLVTPKGFLFYEAENKEGGKFENQDGLVIGISETRTIVNDEIGTIDHVKLVGNAVKEAASAANISSSDEVGLVFVKSPIIRGDTDNFTKIGGSIPRTRAASALGVGLALGEIGEQSLTAEIIATNLDIFSRKAFTFSGNEIQNCRVILLGNTPSGNSKMYIKSGVIHDLLDVEGVKEILLDSDTHDRRLGFFAKVSVHPSGIVRGKRVALVDSDLPAGREIRAAASGFFAALLQSTENFISAGAEHQGPAGGGVVGAIFQRKEIRK